MPADRVSAHSQLLVETVTDRLRPARRLRRLVVPGVAVALLLSASGATAYLLGKPATVRDTIRCYTVDSLEGGDHFRGATLTAASTDDARIDVATDAVGRCADLWREGFLRVGASNAQPPTDGTGRDHPVPPLAACTLEDGVAAVFPGPPDTCQRLDLPILIPNHSGS